MTRETPESKARHQEVLQYITAQRVLSTMDLVKSIGKFVGETSP